MRAMTSPELWAWVTVVEAELANLCSDPSLPVPGKLKAITLLPVSGSNPSPYLALYDKWWVWPGLTRTKKKNQIIVYKTMPGDILMSFPNKQISFVNKVRHLSPFSLVLKVPDMINWKHIQHSQECLFVPLSDQEPKKTSHLIPRNESGSHFRYIRSVEE